MAGPFQCDDCDRTFTSVQGVEAHCYAKGHSRTWYTCCGRTFYFETSYDQHRRDAPAHRTCTICNLIFATADDYERHCSKRHRKSKPVNCNFCGRKFKTPSAYAQHIESGVHNVSRHQVTEAVQMLRIVPQITIAPYLENTTSHIETIEYTSSDIGSIDAGVVDPPAARAISSERNDISDQSEEVVPGPPLGPQEMQVVATTPHVAHAVHLQYVPESFIGLGIPWACAICFKTFRNVFALTAHMNSPVHDPDAFLCPKCNRQYSLVSGLIQHLESGCCKLASSGEIFSQFAQLTSRFSRLLM